MDGTLPDGMPHNHGQVKAEQASREFSELGYRTRTNYLSLFENPGNANESPKQ